MLVGGVLGFALVVLFLLRSERPVVPTLVPTLVPPSEVVILLLGAQGERVVGVWQWWSVPCRVACIVSNDCLPGATEQVPVTEGDYWVAEYTEGIAAGCGLEAPDADRQVILVPRAGFVALVNALDGIQVGGDSMAGARAWEYISSPSLPATQVQARQSAVWLALAEKVRNSPPPLCARLQDEALLFRSLIPAEDTCRQLELVIRQTPAVVRTP